MLCFDEDFEDDRSYKVPMRRAVQKCSAIHKWAELEDKLMDLPADKGYFVEPVEHPRKFQEEHPRIHPHQHILSSLNDQPSNMMDKVEYFPPLAKKRNLGINGSFQADICRPNAQVRKAAWMESRDILNNPAHYGHHQYPSYHPMQSPVETQPMFAKLPTIRYVH